MFHHFKKFQLSPASVKVSVSPASFIHFKSSNVVQISLMLDGFVLFTPSPAREVEPFSISVAGNDTGGLNFQFFFYSYRLIFREISHSRSFFAPRFVVLVE